MNGTTHIAGVESDGEGGFWCGGAGGKLLYVRRRNAAAKNTKKSSTLAGARGSA